MTTSTTDETESEVPTDRSRVVVLFGGRSQEHQVSCVTAGGVLGALDRDAYEVLPVGITRAGRWVLAADDPAALRITDGVLPEVAADGPQVLPPSDPGDPRWFARSEDGLRDLGVVDVVLPLLHGPYGEDGTVQGLLELADLRYVGSGVLSSAVGMDKSFMKLALGPAGLPLCRSVFFTATRWRTDPDGVAAEVASLGWPVFVKPCRAGSSVGISQVKRPEDLAAAVTEATRHDPRVLVEERVVGREIECGVLEGAGGAGHEASALGEISVIGGHDFYDFDAKYLDEGSVALDVPADLPEEVARRVRAAAVTAFDALACEGLARVDFFVREDGSFVVNEVNTMPGFTPFSMFPRLWEAAGVGYPELVDRLLQTAMARSVGLR